MSGFGAVCLVASFLIFIGGLFAALMDRTNERDEARAELDRRADVSDELVSAVAMAESLADELSHADRTIRNLAAQVAAKAEKPDLRILPPLDALPVADGEFPCHDRCDEAELEALMRATEENR